mmetsp:Transcript_7460/g.10993  ORF Transcript_7460/g.10993 Transcript_7460/m.10993 type:complete len:423 (+) Transcript_7460:126-1394(+)
MLLTQKKLPQEGWSDLMIEKLLMEIASMDSNNLGARAGVGEREGRVYSHLVARRNFYLSHGVGRSGDIAAVQPKAAGSSLVAALANAFAKHALRIAGMPKQECIVVPLATGMSITLVLLAIKQQRPQAKYVIWPRIDQKTCLKCIYAAGLQAKVVEGTLEGDSVVTGDVASAIDDPNEVACVLTTSSCFAPRVPDNIQKVALICKEYQIPHLINNAYGLQCSKITHEIKEASRLGRVDAVVQSTDKNFLVPVGGSVISSSSKSFLQQVSGIYPGRASASSVLDLFITFLSMGESGYRKLLQERKALLPEFQTALEELAAKYGQRVLVTKGNTISFGITLSGIDNSTELGSKLFLRKVSGTRVVKGNSTKEICGHLFENYGASYTEYPVAYLTAACAVGLTRRELETFISKLDQIMSKLTKNE